MQFDTQGNLRKSLCNRVAFSRNASYYFPFSKDAVFAYTPSNDFSLGFLTHLNVGYQDTFLVYLSHLDGDFLKNSYGCLIKIAANTRKNYYLFTKPCLSRI